MLGYLDKVQRNSLGKIDEFQRKPSGRLMILWRPRGAKAEAMCDRVTDSKENSRVD